MSSSTAGEPSALSSRGTQRIPPFWQEGWLLAAAALIPVNLAPSLLLVLLGLGRSYGQWGWEVLRDPLHRLALGLSLAVVVVALLGHDWRLSLPGMFNYWPFLGMLPVFARVLAGAVKRKRLAQVLVLSSWLLLLLGWGEVLWGWRWDLFLGPMWIIGVAGGERPAAAFTSANILAIYLVIILCLAAGLLLDKARDGKGNWPTAAWLWSTLGLGSLLLILTASRNGWGVGALVLLLGLGIRRCWWGLGILIGSGIAALAAALDWPGWRAVVPRLLWSRLADTFDPQATYFSSTANRVDAWRFALERVQERPLTGWGWQSFAELYNAQNPPELLGHCHNWYLHLAVEGGIPILLGYLLLWGWILWRSWRTWRQTQEGVLLGILLALVAWLASGLLDVVILDGRIHLLVTLLLGAALGAGQEGRGIDPERS
ncbi:O-antigen ligase family protein [Thermostichus vulcanus]|uniref:O-antigen ligase family protein n=1 Tax=Thermostichus vulcanus str. 'Rupite' TaxID=2813851 RepID=A0ABT0CC68_THEVL|nr:O-antigen ligase family protein [Thermostichus vulcanus]MCJ2543341.1 O-antigen ligase family protein [Thermostichus vulcanus str. 'Rupite']